MGTLMEAPFSTRCTKHIQLPVALHQNTLLLLLLPAPEHGHIDGALSAHAVKVTRQPHINQRPARLAQLGCLQK
jgi:hypothetical protein